MVTLYCRPVLRRYLVNGKTGFRPGLPSKSPYFVIGYKSTIQKPSQGWMRKRDRLAMEFRKRRGKQGGLDNLTDTEFLFVHLRLR